MARPLAVALALQLALAPPVQSVALAAVPAVVAPPSPALRVATVGFRLVTANARTCAKQAMATGLLLDDPAAYDRRIRVAMARQHGFDTGFGILDVVPDSPAARAGLRTNDEIIGIAGSDLQRFRLDLIGKSASYARIEAFEVLLESTLSQQPANLKVNRQGEIIDVTIPQQSGCAAKFAVMHENAVDSWSDGHYVAVTDALARLMDDDELAFVVAHELAHIVLGHADAPHRPLAALGIGAGRIREQESDADRIAVRMIATAGYRPNGASRAFATLVATGNMTAGLTHPAVQQRIKAVTLAAEKIEAER